MPAAYLFRFPVEPTSSTPGAANVRGGDALVWAIAETVELAELKAREVLMSASWLVRSTAKSEPIEPQLVPALEAELRSSLGAGLAPSYLQAQKEGAGFLILARPWEEQSDDGIEIRTLSKPRGELQQ